MMDRWPKEYVVQRGYPPDDVQRYCVQDEDWQRLRLSLKGKPTHEKLEALKFWWDTWHTPHPYETEVQVGNYLGALKRGGQLNDNLEVRKYI